MSQDATPAHVNKTAEILVAAKVVLSKHLPWPGKFGLKIKQVDAYVEKDCHHEVERMHGLVCKSCFTFIAPIAQLRYL